MIGSAVVFNIDDQREILCNDPTIEPRSVIELTGDPMNVDRIPSIDDGDSI